MRSQQERGSKGTGVQQAQKGRSAKSIASKIEEQECTDASEARYRRYAKGAGTRESRRSGEQRSRRPPATLAPSAPQVLVDHTREALCSAQPKENNQSPPYDVQADCRPRLARPPKEAGEHC